MFFDYCKLIKYFKFQFTLKFLIYEKFNIQAVGM